MPRLSIDGREVEVPAGTNLIEAARGLAIEIPYYCYHPALPVAASCRMCQVELHEADKPPRVVVACQTQAADGMVVSTVGEECTRARAATLEFLLANHPLDCPICDKAGECDLQDFAFRHGNAVGRFSEPKRPAVKHELIGDHILLDQERCILCTRCVRFMSEYARAPQLVVAGRGDRNVITTFPGEPMSSPYEGNLADICPVGALTLKEFRFKSRVWDLDSTDSVCSRCDRGCSITLETKRNRLLRVRPRHNPLVNGYFLCDRGRFGLLEDYNPEGRVATVRGAAVVTAASAAEQLGRVLAKHEGSTVAVLSARLTLEEIAVARTALQGFVRDGGFVFVPVEDRGGDGILYTGREAANEAGLRLCDVRALQPGELRSFLEEEATTAALFLDLRDLRREARPALRSLVVLDVWAEPGAAETAVPLDADLFLPGTLLSEKNGTVVNGDGVLQRVRRAQRPPAGVLPEGDLLAELCALRGEQLPPGDPTARTLEGLGLQRRTLMQIPPQGVRITELREVPVA